MNIRSIAKLDPNYFEINREERNYAAILFAALCLPANTERFLALLDISRPVSADFGIYFEYSFLRDLWRGIPDEGTKIEIIRQLLPVSGIDEVLQRSSRDINLFFGVAGPPSADSVQYPGNWSIRKFHKNFPNKDDLLAVCRFKWSFNIKPDIVIHLDKATAVCIEAKYGSSEGHYPSNDKEKAIFQQRGIDYVGQTELQDYMMRDLLGIKARFLVLAPTSIPSETHRAITWKEVFGALDTRSMPRFAQEMVTRISA